MIKIICIGKIKEQYLKNAIDDYLKRIRRYTNIKVIELQDESFSDLSKIIKTEGENILRYINKKDYIITLEINGEEISSLELAKKLNNINIEYPNITFIIGGSYGISKEVYDIANYHLSFSKLTFPHQLFRVILLEQIYRVYKINNNESYHK